MEVDRLLADIELKISRIENKAPQMSRALTTFSQAERLALRWLVLAQRMGLPEDVDAAVNRIARLITAIEMLRTASNLLLASNPVTMAIGVAGLIGGALSVSDAMAGY
jgi:hypothetical protein